MDKQKIFFSYSRVDAELFALKLASDLQKAGANLWVDQLNIELGKLWDEEVEKALNDCDCVLFIATEKSTTSNNVLNEVYYALEENKQVIPVIATKCTLPFRLKRLQYIDFTVDYEVSFNRLLIALQLERPGKDKLVEAITKPVSTKLKEDEKQVVPSQQPNRNSPVTTGPVVNKKWIWIAIVALAVGILGWFLFKPGKSELTTDNPIENNSRDSIKARNEQNALACITALSAGNVDDYLKYFSPEVVEYGDSTIEPVRGIDALKIYTVKMLRDFPDLKVDSLHAVSEADSVNVYGHWTWTLKPELNSGKPEGEQASSKYTDSYKFDSPGKILTHRYTAVTQ